MDNHLNHFLRYLDHWSNLEVWDIEIAVVIEQVLIKLKTLPFLGVATCVIGSLFVLWAIAELVCPRNLKATVAKPHGLGCIPNIEREASKITVARGRFHSAITLMTSKNSEGDVHEHAILASDSTHLTSAFSRFEGIPAVHIACINKPSAIRWSLRLLSRVILLFALMLVLAGAYDVHFNA